VSSKKGEIDRGKGETDDSAVSACVIAVTEELLERRSRKETGSGCRGGDTLMGVDDCSELYIAGVDKRPQDGKHTMR